MILYVVELNFLKVCMSENSLVQCQWFSFFAAFEGAILPSLALSALRICGIMFSFSFLKNTYFYCWHWCLHFPSLCPPPPTLTLAISTLLYLWGIHILVCSLANLYTFFHLVPPPSLSLAAVSLFHCIHDSVSILLISLLYSLYNK